MIPFAPAAGVVVDASIAVKWFLEEPGSDAAAELIDATSAGHLHAPAHWPAEVGNALLIRTRRSGDELGVSELRGILSDLVRIDVRLHALPPLLEAAGDIGVATGATMYDALYVAAAELLDLPFVTADVRLLRMLEGTPWRDRAVDLRDILRDS